MFGRNAENICTPKHPRLRLAAIKAPNPARFAGSRAASADFPFTVSRGGCQHQQLNATELLSAELRFNSAKVQQGRERIKRLFKHI